MAIGNTLDEIMNRDPTQLTKSDIDELIAYCRQRRADREAPKATKAKPAAGPEISLADLGLSKAPVAGLRRL